MIMAKYPTMPLVINSLNALLIGMAAIEEVSSPSIA